EALEVARLAADLADPDADPHARRSSTKARRCLCYVAAMSPPPILFLEASTGGVVGGSLTGILHLIAHLPRARFAPALALYEPKPIPSNGVPIHILPPLPRPAGAANGGVVARAAARARIVYAAVGTRA